MGAGQKLRIDQILEWIEKVDYYQLFNLQPGASSTDIKAAYFKLSKQYHPDRFFTTAEKDSRDKITTVFKRMNEAYTVLKNPEKRRRYDKAISGPDRAKNLRYQPGEEDKQILVSPENQAKTVNGKKYLKLALIAEQKKDWRNAEMNLQFAVKYEPENDFMKKMLERVKEEITKMPKENPFKIR